MHFILEDVFFFKNWTAVSVFVTFFNGDRFKAFIALSLVLTRSLPFSLISILAMACDWLVAVEGSKLLRPALYLAVNAPCLPFPLSPVLSDFLSVPI